MLKSFIIFASHFTVLVILYGRDEAHLVGKPEENRLLVRHAHSS
jgi:hypothetical protein